MSIRHSFTWETACYHGDGVYVYILVGSGAIPTVFVGFLSFFSFFTFFLDSLLELELELELELSDLSDFLLFGVFSPSLPLEDIISNLNF
jgi:hypothetical protein